MAKSAKRRPLNYSERHTQQLFSSTDITNIAEFTGYRILPEASYQAIANGLNSAFFDALLTKDFRTRPSTAELSSSYRLIAASARDLLLALGFRSPASAVMSFSVAEARKRHEGLEFERLLAELVLSGTPPDRDAAPALKLAPQLIAALAHVAEWAGTILPKDAPLRGRPPELGTDLLFQALAGAFHATFGLAPPVGSDRFDEAQGSLRWLDKVFTLAHERVGERILLDYIGDDREQRLQDEPLVILIRKAYQSAPATRANNLRDGWRARLKLSDQEKWPVPIWWPAGFDGGPSVVPKWLR